MSDRENTRKLTIRLTEDAADDLNRVCEITGRSITALVQSMADGLANYFEDHEWQHPRDWECPPDQAIMRKMFLDMLDRAGSIDAQRRSRRRSVTGNADVTVTGPLERPVDTSPR